MSFGCDGIHASSTAIALRGMALYASMAEQHYAPDFIAELIAARSTTSYICAAPAMAAVSCHRSTKSPEPTPDRCNRARCGPGLTPPRGAWCQLRLPTSRYASKNTASISGCWTTRRGGVVIARVTRRCCPCRLPAVTRGRCEHATSYVVSGRWSKSPGGCRCGFLEPGRVGWRLGDGNVRFRL